MCIFSDGSNPLQVSSKRQHNLHSSTQTEFDRKAMGGHTQFMGRNPITGPALKQVHKQSNPEAGSGDWWAGASKPNPVGQSLASQQ